MIRSYKEYRRIVEKYTIDMLPNVDDKSSTLYKSMRYTLEAGGKRLRSILLLACCEFAGGTIEDGIAYACAVEYIHSYSLIHDDLPCMDDDNLRRGKPTNHKVYGEAIALLAGDGLLTNAFEIMNRDIIMSMDDTADMKKRIRAMYEIVKASGCQGMIAGQVADIEANAENCSIDMVDYIHINKTGSMITGAIRAGILLGGGDDDMLYKFTKYAESLGLIYQIRDDVLDEISDEKTLGKDIRSDMNANKASYPRFMTLEDCDEKIKTLRDKAIDEVGFYEDSKFFTDLIQEICARSY